MIYFNSDYLEGAHPSIMVRLAETNMVQTVGYGEDEYCEAAREKIKTACQAPEADVHFLVGGTQTNTTVIAALVYSVPPSVGWEMYTIPGWTMCSVDSSFLCHST